ncbi:unnamed protein product [Rhizophagus irregularis]|nr:unnamed protein product [Rhizophagus irregularis]
MNTEINNDKEVYLDDSESEAENSHIILNSGMKFQSWKEFEAYLDRYALQESFAYKKTRVEYHLSHDKMKDLSVEEKNQKSHQIDCPWRVNVTKPKKENSIGITSVNHNHNHNMNPLIREMVPKFRKFTQPILDDIEFFAKHGTTDAKSIFPLIHAKFPDHPICKKDLYNVIQKFKVGQKNTIENDAANLL